VSYGDWFGLGYCGHYRVWSPLHNRFVIAAAAPPPNPLTITHIVSVPNHVRAWRTSFYDAVGKHNPALSVGDDYELLVRCFLHANNHGASWCHIRACGYYQYRNRDGNFTFIRNSLIQHIVANVRQFYGPRLPPKAPGSGDRPIWQQRSGDEYVSVHAVYDPEEQYDQTVVILSAADIQAAAAAHPTARLVVMDTVTDDIADTIKPRLIWWELSSTDPEDRLCFARKFLTWTPEAKDCRQTVGLSARLIVWGAAPQLTVTELT
jgi:hypothetical protein